MPSSLRKEVIACGVLAPHPPHLVYAENPPQNEPRAEGGWSELRRAYKRLRVRLEELDRANPFDVILVHTPHWRTARGTHILCCESFQGLSVDPIFPHLFRYNYAMQCSVPLAKEIHLQAEKFHLDTTLMKNPDFRVDYGTIVSCHLAWPAWNKPIVALSACTSYDDFSPEVGDKQMIALGEATRAALEKLGMRALLLASCSLSHRHFTVEPALPEDMSYEHIYSHNQYLWDMKVLELFEQGKSREFLSMHTNFIEQSASETRAGSLTWMLSALNFPTTPATVHGYGTVIGTGNAVVEFGL